MSFTSWFKKGSSSGLIKDNNLLDYYYNYINMPSSTTTTSGIPSGTSINTTSGTYQTSSIGSTISNLDWDKWTKDSKKLLAKVGFIFDKKKKEWVLTLSSEIRLPEKLGFEMLMQGASDKPSDEAVRKMKQLKELLVEKITARMILSELVKPREIKTDE